MNVQDVITRVRRVFGDDAAVQILDEDVIRWINDGQIEIVKNNDSALQKTGFVDLVALQSTYPVPTDLFILRSLRFKFDDMSSFLNLKYKNMQQFDETIDGWDGTLYPEGHPIFFTKYEDQVTIFPTPDQSATGGLKFLYNQQPVDVVDVIDPLSVPLIYHNTVWKYCMWQASLLDEDHQPALMYRGEFEKDMGVLQNRETKENTAFYPTITVLADDL